jgi:hypothetical protein
MIAAALVLAPACARRSPEEVVPSGKARAYQLLAEAPERETTAILELRQDVEVDTHDLDRTPHVVATGESPFIKLDGAHAKIYGDSAGTQGWSVDNFVLFEVFDAQGHRVGAAASGYMEPVMIGREHVDNVGRQSFNFEAGEVDLTAQLPERDAFKIRATALDIGGVGRVSDVFLVLTYPERGGDDELKRNSEGRQ